MLNYLIETYDYIVPFYYFDFDNKNIKQQVFIKESIEDMKIKPIILKYNLNYDSIKNKYKTNNNKILNKLISKYDYASPFSFIFTDDFIETFLIPDKVDLYSSHEGLIHLTKPRLELPSLFVPKKTMFKPLKPNNETYKKFTPYFNVALTFEVMKPVDKSDIIINILNKSKKYYKNNILNNNIKKYKLSDYNININNILKGGRTFLFNSDIFKRNYTNYKNERDILINHNTRLSAYLNAGCISIREAYDKLKKYKDLTRQLYWREFYYQVSFADANKYNSFKWNKNKNVLNKWIQSNTGFLIVDAGMKELSTTGILHNRARMICGMFLVKDLLVNWKEGEQYFKDNLIDYDYFSNRGGWCWVSSLIVESQPYFRIFNPIRQMERFDKDHLYIRKFLPEINELSKEEINNYHIKNGIINHDEQVIKAINMFRTLYTDK
jgi:deoxyribodipyrimidine photo-lyase